MIAKIGVLLVSYSNHFLAIEELEKVIMEINKLTDDLI